MEKLFKVFLLIVFFLISSYSAFTQNKTYNKNSYIISLNTVYSSNLITLNSNGYDDMYLITSEKEVKIDSIMCSLSKKDYASLIKILDTIKSHFNIYTIVKDTSTKRVKTDYVSKRIMDYNNYKKGYFFSLNESVKKYGSVVAYVLQIYTLKSKIKYTILNNDCDIFPYECKAIIKKIE